MTDQPEEPTGDPADDEPTDGDAADGGAGDDDLTDVPADQIDLSYELDEWSLESRELLDRLLTTNEVTHAWQGGTLSVNGEDEALVDDLITEVEAASLPGLDPEADKVLYEVAEWSPEERADLTDALTEEGVRFAFDEMGDLLVEAIDEDRVDAIVDDLTDGEEDDVEAPVATDVLSELFVAADKLRRSPHDARAIGQAVEASTTVIAMSPPYGFERAVWAKVGLRAGALRLALQGDDPDDEVVVEAAEALRELLHPMV